MYVNAGDHSEPMRRTKEEADQTRRRIMAAALRTFDRRGIAHTTLDNVAKAAGVTRGAIYWHFAGKQGLLRAIREHVSLPLIDQSDFTLLHETAGEPLQRIERFLLDLLRAVQSDRETRTAFSVMSFKCEYVGGLAGELDEWRRKNEHLCRALTKAYARAAARGHLRAGLAPGIAAMETLVFVVGLMRLWLLDERGDGVRREARVLISAHMAGRVAPQRLMPKTIRKRAAPS